MTDNRIALALHGGAGVVAGRDYELAERDLLQLVSDGHAMLQSGAAAIDVVEQMVAAMEASGLYVAGRGSVAGQDGACELDASIVDGARGRAGAVAVVRDLVHPVRAARCVLEADGAILLAGPGANAFAAAQGLERVSDPARYYRLAVGVSPEDVTARHDGGRNHGTVGAVALDRQGRLAAATSTGGLFGKVMGRVGDTPLPGIGSWADGDIAISCTGTGEQFILAGGARDIAARMRYSGADFDTAARAMLADVADRGGDGGVIAVDRDARLYFVFNTPGMKRAGAGGDRPPFSASL